MFKRAVASLALIAGILRGAGDSYAATGDDSFYKGKTVRQLM